MEKTDFNALQDELEKSLQAFLETFERYSEAADTLSENSAEIDCIAADTEEEIIEALLRLLADCKCQGVISYPGNGYLLENRVLYKKVR